MRICPNCGSEFQDRVKVCIDCGTDLVEQLSAEQKEALVAKNSPKKDLIKGMYTREKIVEIGLERPDQAHKWKKKLESQGIPCVIGVVGGIRLNIKESDLEAALEIMETQEIEEGQEEDESGSSEGWIEEEVPFSYKPEEEWKKRTPESEISQEDAIEEPIAESPDDSEVTEENEIEMEPVEALPAESNQARNEETDTGQLCPRCRSRKIQREKAGFLSKRRWKCQGCGYQWKEGQVYQG